jgi:hypothetical protein
MRLRYLAGIAVLGVAIQGDGIIRLDPSDFRQLPAAVRRDLTRRHCTIPQSAGKTAPHNVLTGSFIAKGSRDWAVLCSIAGRSRILVYRGGTSRRVDSLAALPDSLFVRPDEQGVLRFTRKIDMTDAKGVADMAKATGDMKPASADHDGIIDGQAGKAPAPALHYYRRGKWVAFRGGA